MIANTRNRASPQWRALSEAGVLELDRDKLLQRIDEAARDYGPNGRFGQVGRWFPK